LISDSRKEPPIDLETISQTIQSDMDYGESGGRFEFCGNIHLAVPEV
jgi:hypothetical protein